MNINQPLVSVIMPTYNRADLICESLDSIAAQTYQNWECIIVDDGSTDGTKTVINEYLNDVRFNYYFKENEGAAIARNFAVSKSKGVYILPLDSDDLIHKTYLEKGAKVFHQNPSLRIVYGLANKFGEVQGEWPIPPFDYKLFLVYNMIYNSAIYKRVDFDRVGGYTPGNRFEDWDLWIKILKGGGEVYQIKEVMYYYRTHETGSVTALLDTDKELYLKSMNQLFKNHTDEYLEIIGNPIVLERERRELARIVNTANYKVAIKVMNNPLFKILRAMRNTFKRIMSGK